jgi:hypothetical protein
VKETAKIKQQVVAGQTADGKQLTAAQLSEARNDLSGEERVVSEFPNLVPGCRT